MLSELNIKDFAIIEGLSLAFAPGLNIFTGETGAGKSIIMDAIALILGERASNDLIRSSAEEARVEALFDPSPPSVEGVLKEAGIEPAATLLIKRVVQRAGRNRIYINGSLATLVTLTEVGRRLIDIYGQSEHQSLTRPEEHVEMLDSFGGLKALRSHMAESHREFLGLKKEFDSLAAEAKSLKDRKDLLEFQLKEISSAALKPGEDEALNKEIERLKHAERLKGASLNAEREIYSDDGSMIERLGSIIKSLKDAAAFDERLKKAVEPLESSLIGMEDAGAFLRDYSDAIEADPDALEAALGRADLIGKLKKKYGPSLEEVIKKGEALSDELKLATGSDERSKALEGLVAEAREKALSAAKALTEARANAAKELEERIGEELFTLGMKDAVFQVSMDMEKNPDGTVRFNEKGADRVNFFIAPNKGEGLKPLSRIASGGELSRIMLALKSAASVGKVPALVFDEIDTGVGGAMAQVVGLKLKEVSKAHQVLCITHLPQIAAFADAHFGVSKETTKEGRTVSTVRELKGDETIEQISVMLGGLKVTETTRMHAMELMDAARTMSQKGLKAAKTPAPPATVTKVRTKEKTISKAESGGK
ncbi:MAG: DNA repair protein RecN [Deltaproteobacteria bacterium]|nr:DNA repair protein RecN [Deltaproteobacteria bacterium]